VGRVREAKGQGDFVEALAPLLDRFPAWTPVLVGLTKPADEAWASALEGRCGGRLKRVGEQREVARWYRGLSLVVHPSHGEAFSLVLVEAMAAGCCVVASRLPHHPAIVEHGRTGFLYEPGDVAGLRSILEGLLADPQRVEAVGLKAAEEARARFGIEHEARKLVELYGRAAGGALPAAPQAGA